MSNYYFAMWCSMICSSVFAAGGHWIACGIWFAVSAIYGILSVRESGK